MAERLTYEEMMARREWDRAGAWIRCGLCGLWRRADEKECGCDEQRSEAAEIWHAALAGVIWCVPEC